MLETLVYMFLCTLTLLSLFEFIRHCKSKEDESPKKKLDIWKVPVKIVKHKLSKKVLEVTSTAPEAEDSNKPIENVV
ncbi:unnamed protein product [Parnassius apollo]|uniref:(apollo) hypothetical protein n=1 Tax=Parnassius apollo TaxID=110799 RepID=A0A8S3Y6B1_PARAO|nr:unnamed protein product [Parnassius apollo]